MLKPFIGVLVFLLFPLGLGAKESIPNALESVGITPRIGEVLSLESQFLNSKGERVMIQDILDPDRVTILNFVYLNCPMLCGLLLNGLHDGLIGLDSKYDEKFKIVSVSMDSRDTVASAKAYQDKYMSSFSNRNFEWEFLVGDSENIKVLADSVGFKFKFLEDTGEFAHGASLITINSSGVISQYLYGVMFRPFDLKMAVLESGKFKNISPIDQGLLFCYNYNPEAEGYSLHAVRLMQGASILTVLLIVLIFTIFRLQERKHNGK